MLWSLALAVLALISLSLAHDHQGKRHHHVNHQGDLAPRQGLTTCTGSRFTWFQDGLGACGKVSQQTDFIVAVDSTQFTLELCFQQITITIGGTTQTATIMDECPGCPPCGLDFSQGLFEAFDSLGAGVLTGDWNIIGSGGSSPPSSSAPPPPPSTSETPTTSWAPSPTTTSQPSPTATSATTSSSSTASGTSSSTTVPTQTTTNIIAEPSGVIPGETATSSVLLDLDSYLVLFAGLLESCSSSQ